MRTFVFVIIFIFTTTLIYGQQATLQLKLVNVDNEPIVGALVKINSIKKTQKTDSTGITYFTALQEGTYKLYISKTGLETKTVSVKVKANEALVLEPIVVKESINTLSEVTVISGRTHKYVETAPSIGLRLNVPLIEVPQNISVTTKQTMLNWGILSTSELSKTVSGVVKNYGNFNDFSFNIRGTDAVNNIFRNGVGGYWWNQQEDAAMIERIEFVKGPAGFMIGNSEPGGLVNIITKQPTKQRIREIELGVGSYNLLRSSLDFGGSFSEKSKFTYRLAFGAQTQNGIVQFTKANRYFISPSIRYNFKEKTYLQFEMNRMGGFSKNGSDPSIPSVNNTLFSLPNSFAISDPNIKGLKTYDNASRLSFIHSFKNNWRLNAQVAYINGLYGGDGMYMSGYNEAQDTIYRSYFINNWKNNLKAAQAFMDGEIKQGKHISHKILAGIDYGSSAVKTNYGNLIDSTFTRLPLSIKNPVYNLPADSLKDIEYSSPSNWGNEWLSLYVQDHLKLYNKFIVTIAGRLNYSKAWASYDDNTVKDLVVTPRFGFTYLFNKNISAFVVYDESYLPQTGRKADNTSAKPLTGSNKEIGFKALLLKNKLSMSLSAYKTVKRNVLVQNPNTSLYEERGEISAKGIEGDMVGNITKNITLTANFTYTDARITKDANPDIVGLTNYGTPAFSSNVLVRYKVTSGVLKGLSIGTGLSYMGQKSGIWPQWNDPKDGNKRTPSYSLLDGNIGYDTRKFTFTVNVFNILNTKYLSTGFYTSSFSDTPGYWNYAPGLPTNFRTGIHYRF
jgi:iron complex outermembrane recepter protein